MHEKNSLNEAHGKIPSTESFHENQKISMENQSHLQKVESALNESEERCKSILENIQDAYIRADKAGKIIMVSPSRSSISIITTFWV